MPDYQNNRFARKPFHKRGGDRFGAPTQKYKADCSKCGKVCEVPFRPNGKKPVFCNDCFVRDEGDAPRGRREFSPRPSFDRPQRPDSGLADLKSELQGINEKLGRLIHLMEVSRAVKDALAPVKPAKKRAAKS